jgi:hypothetical protein
MTSTALTLAPPADLRLPSEWLAADDMPPQLAVRLAHVLTPAQQCSRMTHLEYIRTVLIPLHELRLPEIGADVD